MRWQALDSVLTVALLGTHATEAQPPQRMQGPPDPVAASTQTEAHARQGGDQDRHARALVSLGWAWNTKSDLVGTLANCEAIAAFDQRSSLPPALRCLANSYCKDEDLERSRAAAAKLRDKARQLGDSIAEAEGLAALADVEILDGNLMRAAELLTESASLRAGRRPSTGRSRPNTSS